MNNIEINRLSHLLNNCERHIDRQIDRQIDQQMARVSNPGSKSGSNPASKAGSKTGSKKNTICRNNPPYGLKHCLHTINTETTRLDNDYVSCLLHANDSHAVRNCFKRLKHDVNIFTKHIDRECDIKSCKVTDISKAALSCCSNANDLESLTNCFNKMIKFV